MFNNQHRIGFLAHGPASANSLLPIFQSIKQDASVQLFSFHPFVSELWQCPLLPHTLYPEVIPNDLDLILYGTGSGHEIEVGIAEWARQRGIPSVSILDCYWASDENLQSRFKCPPSFLIVPNETVKKKIVDLNLLPAEQILAFGNPHFDRLKPFKQIPKELRFPLDIVFYSQCSTEGDYSDTHPTCKKGLRALAEIQKRCPQYFKTINVTPHPREDGKWLPEFCETHGFNLQSNKHSFELLLQTDLSIGMSCTLQYEAEIIGKPTLFFTSEEELLDQLATLKFKSDSQPITSFHATESCVDWILSYLEDKKQLSA